MCDYGDYEIKYRKESEIDKAFPYLDELNANLKELKKEVKIELPEPTKRKFSILNIFSFRKNTSCKKTKVLEESEEIIPKKTKYISSKKFKKDGYEFLIRFNMKYNESTSKPSYYEVFINIKYYEEKRNKEFYKKFKDYNEANTHYNNWEGMLKHLTRRDIMERLFKEKLNEIEKYSK